MRIAIRPATINDQPYLHNILYYAIYVPQGKDAPPRSIVDLPDIAKYVTDFGKLAFDIGCIAFADDMPVGAAWVRLIHGYGYIDDSTPELTIALLPNYRGRGIGGQLLENVFDAVRPHFKQISLSVTWENPARRLYERLGFETIVMEHGTATMMKRLSTVLLA